MQSYFKGEIMNELNYASFEASKKLYNTGIILETDAAWFLSPDNSPLLSYKGLQCYPYINIPAPCFTEVWRELQDKLPGNQKTLEYGEKSGGDMLICSEMYAGKFKSENPTDALIELLLWLGGKQE